MPAQPPALPPRIAVIGAGGAGLACARLLRDDAAVTLFERDDALGGHARTLTVEGGGAPVHAETGFKYMMLPSHRRMMAWLALHGVAVRTFQSSISLTWEADGVTLVLPPRGPRDLAALLANPGRLGVMLGLGMFQRDTRRIVAAQDWAPTLSSWRHPLVPASFTRGFLQPFFAANWGATADVMGEFPTYDVARVLARWVTYAYDVAAGASAYVEAVRAALGGVVVRTGCPVIGLRPSPTGVQVRTPEGEEPFERVILALPAQHAAPLLGDWPEWQQALGRVRTFPAHIVIHSDPSYMPADPRDWCVINQFHRDGDAFSTEWCGWAERQPVFRTWLPAGRPLPAAVHLEQRFQHLVVTPDTPALQSALAQLQGTGGLYAAGMYVTEVDIHESALASAMGVVGRIAPQSAGLRELQAAIAEDLLPSIQRL